MSRKHKHEEIDNHEDSKINYKKQKVNDVNIILSLAYLEDEDRYVLPCEYVPENGKITCPDCKTALIIKRGNIRRHHFAHLPSQNNNNSSETVCHKSESTIHKTAKQIIMTHYKNIIIETYCKCHKFIRSTKLNDLNHASLVPGLNSIESKLEYTIPSIRSSSKKYRVDIALLNATHICAAIEVVHSNPVEIEKWSEFQEQKIQLFELNAIHVINAYENREDDKEPIFINEYIVNQNELCDICKSIILNENQTVLIPKDCNDNLQKNEKKHNHVNHVYDNTVKQRQIDMIFMMTKSESMFRQHNLAATTYLMKMDFDSSPIPWCRKHLKENDILWSKKYHTIYTHLDWADVKQETKDLFLSYALAIYYKYDFSTRNLPLVELALRNGAHISIECLEFDWDFNSEDEYGNISKYKKYNSKCFFKMIDSVDDNDHLEISLYPFHISSKSRIFSNLLFEHGKNVEYFTNIFGQNPYVPWCVANFSEKQSKCMEYDKPFKCIYRQKSFQKLSQTEKDQFLWMTWENILNELGCGFLLPILEFALQNGALFPNHNVLYLINQFNNKIANNMPYFYERRNALIKLLQYYIK
jgi:hypothetical protein